MSYLVAFHGLPRAGKGTAAQALIQRGFTPAAFGDAIYRELVVVFGVRESELRSHEWKTNPQNLLSNRSCDSPRYRAMLESMGEDMCIPRTSRYHLQRWATEYRRRMFDDLYWIRELDTTLQEVDGPIVIDDLRHPPEYQYLKQFAQATQRELCVIEITRAGIVHTKHSSDDRLAPYCINETIVNHEGHPQVLHRTVLNVLQLETA